MSLYCSFIYSRNKGKKILWVGGWVGYFVHDIKLLHYRQCFDLISFCYMWPLCVFTCLNLVRCSLKFVRWIWTKHEFFSWPFQIRNCILPGRHPADGSGERKAGWGRALGGKQRPSEVEFITHKQKRYFFAIWLMLYDLCDSVYINRPWGN